MSCRYEYRKARFINQKKDDPEFFNHYHRAYWVMLYIIFDGVSLYTFLNAPDWIDNACLLKDLVRTNCTTFRHEILVDRHTHPAIFAEIEKYENNVSKSNND